MGIVRRQGILITITMYTGVAIGYISWGLILPNILVPASLGLIITLRDVSIFFSKLAQIAMMPASLRFFPYFKEKGDRINSFQTFTLLYSIIGFVIFSIVLAVFKDQILSIYAEKSPEIVNYFYYLFPFIFLYVMLDYVGSFFVSFKDYVTFSLFKNVVLRVLVLILVGAYIYYHIQYNDFIKTFIFIHYIVLALLILLLVFRHKIGFSTVYFKEVVKVGFLKFASFNYINGFISSTIRYIDGLMIVSYLGVGSAGIYGVGYLMASIIEMPRVSLNSVIIPLVAQHWKDKEIDKIAELHKKASLNQLIVGLFLFVCIAINVRDVFSLIKPEYSDGIIIVILIGLTKLVTMTTGIAIGIITNSKYYKFNTVNAFLRFILIVTTNVIFIPRYGITGAASATLMSVIGYELILMGYIYSKMKIHPFSSKTLVVILLGLVPLGLNYFVNIDFGIYLNIPLKLIVVMAIYALPIYMLSISSDLNTVVNGFLKKVKFIK